MPVKFLQGIVGEPWLAFNRWLTVNTLGRRLRQRATTPQYVPKPNSLLYVPASVLPYHTSGYTTRTHEVIRALMAAGGDVHVLTRPGYPWDRRDRLQDADAEETSWGGVNYRHAHAPLNNRPVLQFAIQAADVIAQEAIRHRVAVIHAASNHVNALPALLAARRLGIPFQYEMRGLWELSRVSRMPHFLNSQGYRQGLQLEGLVAAQADRLFVISDQLGAYARARWGVDAERLALLPNCIDPARFTQSSSADIEPYTIGYAGTLIGYEGLDTLIDAVAALAGQGHGVRVALIGDGEARASLEEQVQRLGLQDRICFLGRMAPADAQARVARCALVCIPRKPFKVCEIVPPIKLVEALAMGKPVVVPDLPVFRDELGNSEAGWFFRAGDATDLARVIGGALSDPKALKVYGERARAHALSQRCWSDFVVNVLPVAARKEN